VGWLPLRALFAFAVLPGVVAFLVPWVLLDARAPDRALDPIALVPFTLGIALLLWCVVAFYRRGRGTLAPWDPPQELVDTGLYGFSRNPMYVGVSLILWGWALGFHSLVHAIYAAIVIVAFHLRVVFGEEPWLAEKHGERWTRYKARVPRWVGFPRKTAVVALVLGVTMNVAGQGLPRPAPAEVEELVRQAVEDRFSAHDIPDQNLLRALARIGVRADMPRAGLTLSERALPRRDGYEFYLITQEAAQEEADRLKAQILYLTVDRPVITGSTATCVIGVDVVFPREPKAAKLCCCTGLGEFQRSDGKWRFVKWGSRICA
jgi:protein-S-isoprenylcysteine O-methyltransferase Ste14